MNTTITSGRIVQYQEGDKAWPAMVTDVRQDEGEISLTVHTRDGFLFRDASIRPAKPKNRGPGAWWWPEQVKPQAKKEAE